MEVGFNGIRQHFKTEKIDYDDNIYVFNVKITMHKDK